MPRERAMTTTPPPRPITIAILAMGGEGGGVLAEWIVDLAEHGGYIAQMTSVPGVAQRTGATNYYVELFPKSATTSNTGPPVLGLTPVPGDVDIVIASELMEAGRAVQRGLVTPDRTTFIVSTNRVYAMTEKIALADGRVDSAALLEGCRSAAKRLISGDMAQLAESTGSVISSVLFGALAGAQRAADAAHGVRGRDPARRRRRQGKPRRVRRGLRGGDRRHPAARPPRPRWRTSPRRSRR